jgi:hypothetical protein
MKGGGKFFSPVAGAWFVKAGYQFRSLVVNVAEMKTSTSTGPVEPVDSILKR